MISKKTAGTGNHPWPGKREAASPLAALANLEKRAGASLLSSVSIPAGETNLEGQSPPVVVGATIGRAGSGMRAAALLAGSELAAVHHDISRSARSHAPYVVLHQCRAAAATDSGFDAFFSVRDSGSFQLFAANAQEVLDLCLISHRIAERALVPGICGQDAFEHTGELATVRTPDPELIDAFLGRPDDTISCPTPSQELLFGASRRRVPRLLDLDRPVGMGAHLDRSTASRSDAGQSVFFYDHVASIADETFKEFGRLTGREYRAVDSYRLNGADYVVVAIGAVSSRLRGIVDRLRSQGKKVGLVTLRMLRPFPGAELSRLLQGRKKVTVIEPVRRSFAEHPPLTAELRASFDRAIENGRSPGTAGAFPSYPRYERLSDRPVVHSALGASTGDVEEDNLLALFENMMPGGANRPEFHVGARFETSTRVPSLERLGQLMASAYSGLSRVATGGLRGRERTTSGGAVAIHGSADQNLDIIASAVGRTLFDLKSWSVACESVQTVGHHRFEPSGWQVRHSLGDDEPPTAGSQHDVIVVLQPHTLNEQRVLDSVTDGGRIVIVCHEESDVSDMLRRDTRSRLVSGQHEIRRIDAAQIARSLSEDRWVQRQLMAHAAAGAATASHAPLSEIDRQELTASYGRSLKEIWNVDGELLDACLQAFERGNESVAAAQLGEPAEAADRVTEPSAPWTVREAAVRSETVFDPGRFWNSVGYLYESGQREQTLSDPYVATGLVPARTSAFRSWEPYRTEIPTFLPENCTACGACYTVCPDAALPATVIDVAGLVAAAFKQAEATGGPLMQLRRIEKHLVKQAHKLVAGDARHEYRLAGDLLTAATQALLSRMEPSADEAEKLEEELARLATVVETFPIARTDTFFLEPEKTEKGTGLLFSINVNADACKSCGICGAVCPDGAIEIDRQTAPQLDGYRKDWRFASLLQPVARDTIDRFAVRDRPESLAHRLLDRRTYHSMIGGDSSFPGSGTQSTLHVITAMADSVIRPRVERFVAELSAAAADLERVIKEALERTISVNDFEEFGRQLKTLTDSELDPQTLAGIAAGDATVDRRRIEQLNDALLDVRDVLKAYEGSETGTVRASMVGVFSSDHSPTNRGYYPYNPFSYPWVNTSADPVAVAEGAFEATADRIIRAVGTLRRARLVRDDVFVPEEHEAEIAKLSWRDLTDEEWAVCPPVCVFAGDHTEAMSHLLRSRAPVKVFLLSSEVSHSMSASDVRLWPMARPDLFVLRSTIGLRGHLLDGLLEGFERRGPALFHLYVAEPSEHGYEPAESVNRMRMAVESRAFPVMKYNPGVPGEWAHRWSLAGNPAPDHDFLTVHPSRTSGSETPLTAATWGLGEARFRPFYRHVPRNHWTGAMIPLSDYLDLDSEARAGREPYVEVSGSGEKTSRIRVLPEIVQLVERTRSEWRLLQELAGVRSSVVDKVSEEAQARFDQELEGLRRSLREEFEAREARTRAQFGTEFHSRLTSELLEMSGFGESSSEAVEKLSQYLERLSQRAPSKSDAGSGNGADQ